MGPVGDAGRDAGGSLFPAPARLPAALHALLLPPSPSSISPPDEPCRRTWSPPSVLGDSRSLTAAFPRPSLCLPRLCVNLCLSAYLCLSPCIFLVLSSVSVRSSLSGRLLLRLPRSQVLQRRPAQLLPLRAQLHVVAQVPALALTPPRTPLQS